MKLTKREKIMTISLTIGILFYSYFYFIIGPQISKLKALNKNIITYKSEIQRSKTILASKEKITNEYEKLNTDRKSLEKGYFSSIEQEFIIILLNEMLDDTGIQVSSINFSEPRKEDVNAYTLNGITVDLPFAGSYEALLSFLKKIREYDKKIIVNSLNIENNKEDQLSGNIYLDFYSLSNTNNDNNVSKYFDSSESGKENPFSPFEGFEREDENYEQETASETGEIVNKVVLNGFEEQNTFFVGSSKNIYGKITRDTNQKEGKYSIRLAYDFITARKNNTANIVYEGKKVLIPKQAEKISIWTYAFEKNNHKIGIAIKDAKGKLYTIPLANQIDWTGWKDLETALPLEISYPAEVQRIYVESIEFDNNTKGIFLFDKLEAAYSKVLSYTNEIIPLNGIPQYEPQNKSQYKDETTYVVQRGDTIFSIAKKFYQDYTKRYLITEYNQLNDSSDIRVGQILRIPILDKNQEHPATDNSVSKKENTSPNIKAIAYKVKPKDTIFSISKQFYNDYTKRHLILEYNHIQDPSSIKAGQVIYIPKAQ